MVGIPMLSLYLVDRRQYPAFPCFFDGLGDRDSKAPSSLISEIDKFILSSVLARISRPILGQDFNIERHHSGKPFIRNGPFFNISHSGEYLVIAISDAEVGVDIEYCDNVCDINGFAHRFFTFEEQLWLLTSNRPLQKRRFTKLWSLKEAHLKRIGVGLSGGLGRFRLLHSLRNAVFGTSDSSANYWSVDIGHYVLSVSSESSDRPTMFIAKFDQVGVGYLLASEYQDCWEKHIVFKVDGRMLCKS